MISDPFCADLKVRTVAKIVLLPDGRASHRNRLLTRGLSDVSWRVKLESAPQPAATKG